VGSGTACTHVDYLDHLVILDHLSLWRDKRHCERVHAAHDNSTTRPVVSPEAHYLQHKAERSLPISIELVDWEVDHVQIQ